MSHPHDPAGRDDAAAANAAANGANGARRAAGEPEYGPLGPGHAPEKDPMKGLRGVMAGTLIMHAIVVFLGLTVLVNIDDGAHANAISVGYVTALGLAMVVMAFLQGRPWALKANMVLVALGVLAVVFHWSLGVVGVFFALVWAYMLHLRSNLIARMERGLLTTQHT
ncbi:DUF4233 domain-containing protein [Corynebacterium sp. 335C]